MTCDATDQEHAERITAALGEPAGFTVRKVSDRTFLIHLGGKIEVTPKVSLRTRDDLSRAYTPGVARVCLAIAENPADARRLTIKRNTVAVVTDGSAVLGLGNIGPAAALPVMEGKAALFKQFAGVDAWPVVPGHPGHRRDRRDRPGHRPGLRRHQPGGHRRAAVLRDRGAAARDAGHPGLPRRPARHRHRASLAALRNALRVIGQDARRGADRGVRRGRRRHRDHQAAAGPGRHATSSAATATGAVHPGSVARDDMRRWLQQNTNPEQLTGSLADVLDGRRRVHRRVGAEPAAGSRHRHAWPPDAIVFALANPVPEVDPMAASEHAAVVATGRSDFSNQINNVLAFPGFFRGLLDTRRHGHHRGRC